mgnify:CR=1 FL=1
MVINLPLSVQISRNKKFILNLNNYRNAHFQVLNKAKKLYAEQVFLALGKQKPCFNGGCQIVYTLFQPTNRRVDISNPLSVIDKFACDALVELGVLPDDANKYVQSVSFQWGGVDKNNPRCEMTIRSL